MLRIRFVFAYPWNNRGVVCPLRYCARSHVITWCTNAWITTQIRLGFLYNALVRLASCEGTGFFVKVVTQLLPGASRLLLGAIKRHHQRELKDGINAFACTLWCLNMHIELREVRRWQAPFPRWHCFIVLQLNIVT